MEIVPYVLNLEVSRAEVIVLIICDAHQDGAIFPSPQWLSSPQFSSVLSTPNSIQV